MPDNDNHSATPSASPPTVTPPASPPTAPSRELEIKVKQNPDDKDAKVDLGSDESMDASDPSSATQPTSPQPVPSSGFPEVHDSPE